jgi:hypothetical protein
MVEAGAAHGIDEARVERIIQSINAESARPAAEKFSDIAPWQKIRKLDRDAFEANCPALVKDAINSKITRKRQDIFAKTQASSQGQHEIIFNASRILTRIGQQTETGLSFQGKTYGIHLSHNELKLTKQNRTILKQKDGNVTFSRITERDRNVFSKFANYVDNIQENLRQSQPPIVSPKRPQVER